MLILHNWCQFSLFRARQSSKIAYFYNKYLKILNWNTIMHFQGELDKWIDSSQASTTQMTHRDTLVRRVSELSAAPHVQLFREHYLGSLFTEKETGTYLKAFSCFKKRAEGFLGHMYLSTVHEFEEGCHIVGTRPVENNDQSRGRRRHSFEKLLKVLAACCED